ncbi:DUF2714 domain-containing protein [Mycoplasmopsis synoviae]|nr:DUF2714 domain-containing protein [Mycoplasmopsis synoviae]AKB10933.1 hypothetical protein VY93_00835 [Mycoplasmopsis synoviae ATCC 25204]
MFKFKKPLNSKSKKTKEAQYSKEQLKYQDFVYKNYFEILSQAKDSDEKFLSYEQFVNQFYLKLNQKDKISEFNKLWKASYDSFFQKQQVVFDDFVLAWTRNERFSLHDLVPYVSLSEDSNVLSTDLSAKNNDKTNLVFKHLNNFLKDYLFEKLKVIEIFPNVILFLDENSKFKLLFDKSVVENER